MWFYLKYKDFDLIAHEPHCHHLCYKSFTRSYSCSFPKASPTINPENASTYPLLLFPKVWEIPTDQYVRQAITSWLICWCLSVKRGKCRWLKRKQSVRCWSNHTDTNGGGRYCSTWHHRKTYVTSAIECYRKQVLRK